MAEASAFGGGLRTGRREIVQPISGCEKVEPEQTKHGAEHGLALTECEQSGTEIAENLLGFSELSHSLVVLTDLP